MRNLIRSMSAPAEASIVIALAFGYFIFSTFYALFESITAPHITDQHLLGLLVMESPVLALLGGFLYLRGWSFERLGLSVSRQDTLIGLLIAVIVMGVNVLIWSVLNAIDVAPSYLGADGIVAGRFSLPLILAVSILNAVYEETFVCAYLISLAKEKDRLSLGVNASVAIRLAYHLYQGGVGVVTIIPFGLMCAWWFAKTGRIWPIIVAHALIDIVALSVSPN